MVPFQEAVEPSLVGPAAAVDMDAVRLVAGDAAAAAAPSLLTDLEGSLASPAVAPASDLLAAAHLAFPDLGAASLREAWSPVSSRWAASDRAATFQEARILAAAHLVAFVLAASFQEAQTRAASRPVAFDLAVSGPACGPAPANWAPIDFVVVVLAWEVRSVASGPGPEAAPAGRS